MGTLHPFVRVIVITARPGQQEQAQKMRIDALMEKPLDLPLLLRSIHDLLEEPDQERIGRITDPRFKTTLFNQTPISDATDETAKGMEARKV